MTILEGPNEEFHVSPLLPIYALITSTYNKYAMDLRLHL